MKINKCKHCQKETKNPSYCSRRCSAKSNNKKFPKRKPEGKCFNCKTPTKRSRKYCKSCYKRSLVDWSTITLDEMVAKRDYQKYSRIRNLARKIYLKSDKPKNCVECGYDKNFHVCHKKAISEFDKKDKVSEINDLDNLIALCPNHHWEFDNNLLKV